MSSGYFANLRPQERRLVVIVGVVFFVVINFWFVFPKFGAWGDVQARMWAAQQKLQDYENEIAQLPKYQAVVRKMESEGQQVLPEEQSIQFSRAIQTHQAQSGVNVISTGKMQVTTNQFFIELNQAVSLQGKEDQLVNFLYNLGSGNSLIRVRDLSLRRDPSGQQLMANTKLVASYKKAAKPGTPGRGAPASRTAGSQPIATAQRQ
jgi:Tfp pilus assembly protein PilO